MRDGKRRTATLLACLTVATVILCIVAFAALHAEPVGTVDLPHQTNQVGMKFVQLPAGEFLMGSRGGSRVGLQTKRNTR